MSPSDLGWTAVIAVRLPRAELATWLERSLSPEVAREVPRAQASVRRPDPHTLELVLTARDTGSVRAAMNTYLGWVHLALATVGPARDPAPVPSAGMPQRPPPPKPL